ncbi:MAG: YraN family protein [Clostridia bacterium]|nr:YraN family protein [Clostridia bacterium]
MPQSAADGILAEVLAGNYLEEKGYKIVGRNVAYPKIGELDLVCEDGKTLVFVEVKYRKDNEYGSPLESITVPKMRKLIKAANRYLTETNSCDRLVRFDVVCVMNDNIEHYINAFYGDFI